MTRPISLAFEDLIVSARRHQAAGDFPAAMTILANLLQARPNDKAVLVELGRLSLRMGSAQDAVVLLQTAQQFHPDDAEIKLELAAAMEKLGQFGEALALLETVAASPSAGPTPLLRLSYFHRRRHHYDASERVCRRLVDEHPTFAMGWVSLGTCEHIAGRVEAAESCFQKALAREPDNPIAHFARAANLLCVGQWQEGFAEFRWRRRLPDAPCPPLALPDWAPTDRPGTRVAIWNDQGFGDAIQFLRHVRHVRERGFQPLLILGPELARLAETVPGVETVFRNDQALPSADRQVPLCDLPHCLGLTDPAWSGPYVATNRVPSANRADSLQVGLVWAGSPHHENDTNRSVSLATLGPLLDLPGIDWTSLQIGPRSEDLRQSPWQGRVRDISAGIKDFADTAEIVERLDLVITIDSAVAHLSAAMGKPTWIMIAERADWRWLREGAETAWYPSVRLFRQQSNGWPQVVAELAAGLTKLVG